MLPQLLFVTLLLTIKVCSSSSTYYTRKATSRSLSGKHVHSKSSNSNASSPVSTMKQKIVMKVQFSSQKRRTDAFKIAAGPTGVSNVYVEADKDQIIVIADGVDSFCLVKSLRKKLRYVEIVSVGEVKKPEEEKKPAVEIIPIQWTSSNYVHYPMPNDLVYRW